MALTKRLYRSAGSCESTPVAQPGEFPYATATPGRYKSTQGRSIATVVFGISWRVRGRCSTAELREHHVFESGKACGPTLMIFDDCNHHPPVTTWAVELAEEDVLPTGKPQFSIHQRDGLGRSHEPRLQVGVTITILGIV